MSMNKRAIAFLLTIVMIVGFIPFYASAEESPEFVNYGAAIGNTAVFDTEYWSNFLVFDNPKEFVYDGDDNDWDNDAYWIYSETDDEVPDVTGEDLFVVSNYYWDPETTALWYQLKAAPGHELPEKMQEYPWAFQDFTDPEMMVGDALIIFDDAENFIYIGDPSSPTSSAIEGGLELSMSDHVKLSCATTLQGKVAYQWQILVDDMWVDILGENDAQINVTAAMLFSALDGDRAELRCVTRVGSRELIGEEFSIELIPDEIEEESGLISEDEITSGSAISKSKLSDSGKLRAAFSNFVGLFRSGSDPDEGVAPAAIGDIHYITVRYLFTNDVEAANPYVAQVSEGDAFTQYIPSPTVLGYLPYYEGEQLDGLQIDETNITEDKTYTVIYQPTNVEYKIDVYFQNVHDDNYEFIETRTMTGLTGTLVPHDTTLNFEGMHELLHATPEIAANGSTRLEVRFNRNYYLFDFELDGGTGIYPIYGRYGADLASHIGMPIRPGFIFRGWDEITATHPNGDGVADPIPATVPAGDMTFKALWQEKETAEVRIAFWGQNPNPDPGTTDKYSYSYLESQTIVVDSWSTVSYQAGGNICGIEEHSHNNSCQKVCGEEEHVHSASCYELDCDVENHTHVKGCYPNVGNEYSGNGYWDSNEPWGAPSNPKNGEVYKSNYSNNKYVYLVLNGNGRWYQYDGTANSGTVISSTCGKEHVHTDYTGSCYRFICELDEHVHDESCYVGCVPHTHGDTCRITPFEGYSTAKWTLVYPEGEPTSVTAVPDDTAVLNVYFDRTEYTMTFKATGNNGKTLGTITDKWGADIRQRFQDISKANTFLWSKSSDGGSPWTSFIDVMPVLDGSDDTYSDTYYANTSTSNNTQTATYYGQTLDGGYEVIFTSSIKYKNNLTVSKEEFVEIEGYIFNDPKSTDTGKNYNGATFYYDRAGYRLEFFSGTAMVREETMLFEESFGKFNSYVPPLPSEYKPGSRYFAGWYLNPELTNGPITLSDTIMPAGNMTLYAKWEPILHTVNIYKEKFSDGTFGDATNLVQGNIKVLNGQKVFDQMHDMDKLIPDNEPYTFLGWFYMDDDVERRWDFENSIVEGDTNIYAKWSSEVLIPYTVRFIVQNGDGTVTQIADPIESSSLAGSTVTFEAKVGNELYSGYRQGYFPLTTSNSLTMDINCKETGMSYDFIYVAKDKVPYTVRYVDKEGNELHEPKVVENNTYAVVTEKFVPIEDYIPDASQKTLVLEGGDDAENVITFVYTQDNTQGIYTVAHYIQNEDGTEYRVYSPPTDKFDKVGTVIKVAPLTINGFTYDHALVNDVTAGLTDGTVNGTVAKSGLEIELYYTRNKYPYKIQYKDSSTGDVLKAPDIITPGDYYGRNIQVQTIPAIDDYNYESSTTCVIAIEEDLANPVHNILTVYYTEKSVRIDYVIIPPTDVDPEDCGTVVPEFSNVKVNSSMGASSLATAKEGFLFDGWYEDEACTVLVTDNANLSLVKPSGGWTTKTYYAKFVPGTGDLTITRSNASDSSQVFVYSVKNNETSEIIYVSITGNGSVTIVDLPLAEYTVTQENDWSWRYSDASKTVDHNNMNGTVVMMNKASGTDQWLNGNSEVEVNKRR